MLRVLAVSLFLFFTGCAHTSNFESTPVAQKDFEQPLPEIRESFSDVEFFESRWRGIPNTFGSMSALESKWGKADEVEVEWGDRIGQFLIGAGFAYFGLLPVEVFAFVEAMSFNPSETHHWNKGSTHITVESRRVWDWWEEKKVIHWKWEKVNEAQLAQSSAANN